MTSLKTTDIENFWIRCYLGSTKSLLEASVDRAYRDFNRTIHGVEKKLTAEMRANEGVN